MELQKKALIIELKFHQEIIPAQIFFLLGKGYEVHLFLAEHLYDRDLFNGLKDQIYLTLLPHTKGFINKVRLLFKVKLYIKQNKISRLILNTLDSNFNNFLLRIINDVQTIGIIHQLQKLKYKPLYYDNFKRVSGVLTLSQYTLRYLTKNYNPGKPVSFFYPVFFPYNINPNGSNKLSGPEIINIAIPGQLDQTKRDYKTLIEILATNKEDASKFKFFLLGNAASANGPEIVSLIKSAKLESLFSYTEGFVSYNHFFSCLSNADYVMPLLNKKIQQLPTYHASQISASFNWAYAFNKPLIVHQFYINNVVSDYQSIGYSDYNLSCVLFNLVKPQKGETARSTPFFDFKAQQENYLKVFL